MNKLIKRGWFATVMSVAMMCQVALAQSPTDLPKVEDSIAEARARELVSQMTLDEKILLLSGHGHDRYDHLAVERLGIPPLLACDAGLGVRTTYAFNPGLPTTSFQSGLSLAASFDEEAAYTQGRAMGIEAYLLGYGSILGPVPDAARTPYYGRNFESLGEDPLLAGKLAAAQTLGQQESPVITSIKHYTGNVQEWNRHVINELISERALREYYARAYEIIVKESQPGGIMAAFNYVNGEACVNSYHLLTEILKEDFGHKGYVQTDFNGSLDVENALAGLDFEGPATQYFGEILEQAIADEVVPMERVDDMVFRWLYPLISLGYFDNPPPNALVALDDRIPLDDELLMEHSELAYENALKGVVLLKNENEILPIGGDVTSIALIGTDLDTLIGGGGSASIPVPGNEITVLDGIMSRAAENGATVTHVKGVDSFSPADMLGGPATPVPSSVLTPLDPYGYAAAAGIDIADQQGAVMYVYDEATEFGSLVNTRLVQHVNLASGIADQFPNSFPHVDSFFPYCFGPHSIQWFANFACPATGTYTFYLHHMGGAQLIVNGNTLISEPADTPQTDSFSIDMVGGEVYSFEINYWMNSLAHLNNGAGGMFSDGGIAKLRLSWEPPVSQLPPNIQEAAAAAGNSDVAVVCVRDYNSEAMDRHNITLQQDQERLIRAVSEVNDRVIVVLQTGGPVTMPWLDDVDGLVEAWYSGQEQGRVLADILFGDVNPSGKLPMTFPVTEEDQPYPINTYEGSHGTPPVPYPGYGDYPVNDFSEGIYVGYRGYDEQAVEPLFPFGYGLSYTTFEYSKVKLSPKKLKKSHIPKQSGVIDVHFRLTNKGNRAGTEVAQVYIQFPDGVEMPEKQLVGYKRVSLKPGETRKVTVEIDIESSARPLSMYDVLNEEWVVPEGQYTLLVGGSSGDLSLSEELVIEK